MTNVDIVSNLDPQGQIIYLLGQIQGELKAVHSTIDAQNARQTAINVEVKTELSTQARTIAEHGEELAVLRASQQPRLTWPQIIVALGSAAALILSIRTLFPSA